jgi:4-hydroxy-tetrahydrodipicolinate reductase
MAEKLAMTMAQLVTEVTHVRIVEALNFQRAAENMWGGLRNIGFGGEPFQTLEQREGYGSIYYGDCATTIGHELYGAGANDVWVESERRGLPARKKVEASGLTIEEGEVAVLHLIHRGYLNDRHFFTNEEIWYIGRDNAFQGDDLPFDGFKGPAAYVIEISGQPADLRTQLEFKSNQRGVSPITNGSVRSVLDAVPAVCAAEPGILIDDVTPHVKLDDRIPPLAG